MYPLKEKLVKRRGRLLWVVVGVFVLVPWLLLFLVANHCLQSSTDSNIAVSLESSAQQSYLASVGAKRLQHSKDTVNVVFAMGLESTGHHVFQQLVFRLSRVLKMSETRQTQAAIHIEHSDPLEFALMYCWAFHMYDSEHELDWAYAKWETKGKELKSWMQEFSIYDTCAVFEKVLTSNIHRQKYSGNDAVLMAPVLSYPFMESAGNWLPDVNHFKHLLHKAFAETNVNVCLKVVVLTRDLRDALRSTCVRFGDCHSKVRVYAKYLSEMQAQLSLFESTKGDAADGCNEWKILPFESILNEHRSVVRPLLEFMTPSLFQSGDATVVNQMIAEMQRKVAKLISNDKRDAHHSQMADFRVDSDTQWEDYAAAFDSEFASEWTQNKWPIFQNKSHFLLQK